MGLSYTYFTYSISQDFVNSAKFRDSHRLLHFQC